MKNRLVNSGDAKSSAQGAISKRKTALAPIVLLQDLPLTPSHPPLYQRLRLFGGVQNHLLPSLQSPTSYKRAEYFLKE
jgi:hypothetical protein